MSERFDRALVYASGLHRNQQRKRKNLAYISHLMSVAALVLEAGGDEDQAIAALLHDAVEDQPVTLEEIRARFGERVARIVEGCTDAEFGDKPPWEERKKAYLNHIAEATDDVRLVAAADKLHNARSILADYRREGEAVWGRFNGKREGTLWYYRALADGFRGAGGNPLVDELERVVSELESLAGASGAEARERGVP